MRCCLASARCAHSWSKLQWGLLVVGVEGPLQACTSGFDCALARVASHCHLVLRWRCWPDGGFASVPSCLQIIKAGGEPPVAVVNLVAFLMSVRTVFVQDALELAPQFPHHPVFCWVMEQPEWPELLAAYQANKASGVSNNFELGTGGSQQHQQC